MDKKGRNHLGGDEQDPPPMGDGKTVKDSKGGRAVGVSPTALHSTRRCVLLACLPLPVEAGHDPV